MPGKKCEGVRSFLFRDMGFICCFGLDTPLLKCYIYYVALGMTCFESVASAQACMHGNVVCTVQSIPWQLVAS